VKRYREGEGTNAEETCAGAVLSTTNFLCTGPWWNPSLGGLNPATTGLGPENPRPVKTVRVSYRCQFFLGYCGGKMKSVFLL